MSRREVLAEAGTTIVPATVCRRVTTIPTTTTAPHGRAGKTRVRAPHATRHEARIRSGSLIRRLSAGSSRRKNGRIENEEFRV